MLQDALGLLLLLITIALPIIAVMAVVLYGSRALGWGFHRYPKLAALVTLVLVLTLFAGAASFNRLFPNCDFHWGMFGGISHCSQPVTASAAIRPEINNLLKESLNFAQAHDYKAALARVDAANAIASKSPEEQNGIDQVKAYLTFMTTRPAKPCKGQECDF